MSVSPRCWIWNFHRISTDKNQRNHKRTHCQILCFFLIHTFLLLMMAPILPPFCTLKNIQFLIFFNGLYTFHSIHISSQSILGIIYLFFICNKKGLLPFLFIKIGCAKRIHAEISDFSFFYLYTSIVLTLFSIVINGNFHIVVHVVLFLYRNVHFTKCFS